MKILIALISIVLCLSAIANAQSNITPSSYKLYNSWSIPVAGYADSTAVAYSNGRVDTLPNWRSQNTTILAAGARSLSLTFATTDSSHATFVVKSKVRGAATSTYTTILTDSIYNWSGTPSTNYRREVSLKTGDADLFDNIDQEFIIIITHSSFGNDTQGTALRRVRLNWVP